nr:MAG TPA: hypothetical protein [Caudoviricetes sp.]
MRGAAALGRRPPTRPRRFLAPGGEAFLGSPCRGSLRCAALGRHARPRASLRPRAPTAIRLAAAPGCRPAAPSCRGEGRTCRSEAV